MDATTTLTLQDFSPSNFLNLFSGFSIRSFSLDALQAWGNTLWHIASSIAFLLTLMSLAILIYSTMRLRQIRHAEHHLYSTIEEDALETMVDHNRFKHIMTLIESAHESDWRQAIIEADIMLDDLLKQLKLSGDTLGDRLKNADRSRFKTLDNAWAAHKVRNEIAHTGSSYSLSNHLAYRTIKQYESVFKEFGEI